uniref:Uncharacterized protein n=1 Tax=Anguilla anguilla TaxID=7936 RepID=A0A0E9WQ27_ANGAN
MLRSQLKKKWTKFFKLFQVCGSNHFSCVSIKIHRLIDPSYGHLCWRGSNPGPGAAYFPIPITLSMRRLIRHISLQYDTSKMAAFAHFLCVADPGPRSHLFKLM